MKITDIVGTININGKQLIGKCVEFINNKLTVDGIVVSLSQVEKEIHITITGNCADIKNDVGSVTIQGDAADVTTEVGDVLVKGNVNGNIKNEVGSITVSGSVSGDLSTEVGNINCKKV